MVHIALLLPEVVAAILDTVSEELGLLFDCLLVDHLFLEEASRILWYKCGASGGLHPDIEDLGAMILRDDVGPQRAQVYTNLLRAISFHYGGSLSNNTCIDQTSWHTVLCQVRFPQLLSVWSWETEHGHTQCRGGCTALCRFQSPQTLH